MVGFGREVLERKVAHGLKSILREKDAAVRGDGSGRPWSAWAKVTPATKSQNFEQALQENQPKNAKWATVLTKAPDLKLGLRGTRYFSAQAFFRPNPIAHEKHPPLRSAVICRRAPRRARP
jgi:hypothetical protein